ncbi:MAG: hypothetical protein AAGF12_42250, partial [Myxococcota bacterium]
MPTPDSSPTLAAILPPVRRVVLRVRAQRAVNALVACALFSVGGTGLGLGLLKAHVIPAAGAELWLVGLGLFPLVGAIVAALFPVGRLRAASLLDQSHELNSRITSALEFGRLPAEERTDFMTAAMEDARAHVSHLSAARAFPFRIPPLIVPTILLGQLVVLIAFLE